jgi:hypothetical protein
MKLKWYEKIIIRAILTRAESQINHKFFDAELSETIDILRHLLRL